MYYADSPYYHKNYNITNFFVHKLGVMWSALPLNCTSYIEEKSEWKYVKCFYYMKILGFPGYFTSLSTHFEVTQCFCSLKKYIPRN